MIKKFKNGVLLLSGLLHGVSVYAQSPDKFMNSEIVSLEETLERFYIIQRIDPLMHLIQVTPDYFWIFPEFYVDEDGLQYDGVSFNNPQILALISAIDSEHSIQPVLHVWGELKRYKYLHDIALIKEFAQLLFVVTRYSFRSQLPLTFENDIAVKNVYSLDAVDALSLEQVLDVLDIIIEDMPSFIEKYELQSNLTWKEWMRKYWPIAPIAFAAFALKIYASYQAQYGDQSGQQKVIEQQVADVAAQAVVNVGVYDDTKVHPERYTPVD